MSYPDLPENRLIVNGVDLAVRYNMVLLDGYTLSPPEPKTTTVEVPGRDGVLDLTESLIGDVSYGNRSMTFTFLIVDLEQFEVVKTQISNALHGRKFNFEMTMDPGYTYTGRFKINSYTHTATWSHGICGFIEVEIDAEPYKLKSHYVYNLNATGGATFNLESGRKKVHPIVELSAPARIRFKNVVYRIGAGRFQLNDILFEEGINDIYINSFELFNLRWDEWKPIGPARIIVNASLDEGETLYIAGSFNNWNKTTDQLTKDELTGSYYYDFLPSSASMGKTIEYQFIKIPSEFDGDISTLSGDCGAGHNRVVQLTMRSTYTSTFGNLAVTTAKYNNSANSRWNEWTKTRWDELHKLEGNTVDVHQKWSTVSQISWADMGKHSWKHWNFHVDEVPDAFVKLEYDWKDL